MFGGSVFLMALLLASKAVVENKAEHKLLKGPSLYRPKEKDNTIPYRLV
jgi:hypothetical protein